MTKNEDEKLKQDTRKITEASIREAHEAGMSVSEIGEMYSLREGAVYNRMVKYGLKREITKLDLKSLLDSGLSVKEISEKYDATIPLVYSRLKEYGLKTVLQEKYRSYNDKKTVKPSITFEDFEDYLSQDIPVREIVLKFDIKMDQALKWQSDINERKYAPKPVQEPVKTVEPVVQIVEKPVEKTVSPAVSDTASRVMRLIGSDLDALDGHLVAQNDNDGADLVFRIRLMLQAL